MAFFRGEGIDFSDEKRIIGHSNDRYSIIVKIKTNREELLKNTFKLFVRMNYEKASFK